MTPRRRWRRASAASSEAAYPSVTRSTTVMAVGTSLSRATGVLRVGALAYAVGAVALADSYNLANTMPNIIQDIVIGGVLSATFVPVFVQRLTTRTDDEAWEAISAVVSVALVVIGVASLAFLVATPFIIDAITSFSHSAQAATGRSVATDLLFLFVPQLACYGFISIATALLNSRRRFAAPMFTPVANNVLLIVVYLAFGSLARSPSLVGAAHHRSWLLVLGLGTTLGVMVQAALLVPSLRRAGLRLKFRFDLRHEAVRNIGRLSGWTFGLVLANQLALLVVLAASEHVGAGAVSAYTYAYIFFQLPYAVVAVSVMAATAPELATHWARGEQRAFRRRMSTGLRTIVALVVPAAAGMLVLARPLVALVYGHGATGSHTLPTATSLAMLALGIPGFCVFLYAIRVLQSIQDLRSAFWLYVLENGVNIVLAVTLAGPLGVRGIALSISIAYTVAAVVALVHLRRHVDGLAGIAIARHLAHVLMATAVLVAATVVGSNLSASESFAGLLLRVVAGTVAGAAAYVVAAGVLSQIGRPADGAGDGAGGEEDGDVGRSRPGNGSRAGGSTRRLRRSGAPTPPARLEPAGRPPIRPATLGPTRTDPPPGTDRERLDQ